MITNDERHRAGGKAITFGFLALLVLLSMRVVAGTTDGGTIVVSLRPSAPDRSGRIGWVEIAVREPVSTDAAGKPLVRMPLVTSNVRTVASVVRDIKARDADGPLALTYRDDPAGQKPYRHWIAARPVHGPVTINYRVAISDAPNPLGAAPPFELRSEDAVFSGLTGAFLILPDIDRDYRLALHWNFAGLGGHALGVSTLGLGDRTSTAAESPDRLESIFVMGGRLAHEPDRPAADGFFSAWQGTPPFDARALLQWTHRLYAYYLKFFHASNTTYTVYLRRNPINPGGGVEVQNSFVGTFGQHTKVGDFKLTLAHEMVHTFVGALDAKSVKDELADSWFAEGLAVYYQRLLPWRAGQISRAAYLRDLNATAARYYTDKLNTTPNDRIADRFWPDTRVRVLPYDRGSLYFAQLNAEISKASGGKRSLDNLLFAFLRRRAGGKPLTQSAWVDVVTRELGVRGKQQFDDMMSGKPIILNSDAFGLCFRRVVVPLHRYQLGFTPDVLIEPRRIVRGLIPTSAAARAGLRNGDEIIRPVPQDGIQADQHATLTLRVRRGKKVMDITYLPRGKVVDTYQWVESGDKRCRTLSP